MTEREFKKLYLGGFEDNTTLFQIGIKYHYDTEIFDRSICSFVDPRDNKALPMNGDEYVKINKYARERRKAAYEEGMVLGYDNQSVYDIILDTSRYSLEELKGYIELWNVA